MSWPSLGQPCKQKLLWEAFFGHPGNMAQPLQTSFEDHVRDHAHIAPPLAKVRVGNVAAKLLVPPGDSQNDTYTMMVESLEADFIPPQYGPALRSVQESGQDASLIHQTLGTNGEDLIFKDAQQCPKRRRCTGQTSINLCTESCIRRKQASQ